MPSGLEIRRLSRRAYAHPVDLRQIVSVTLATVYKMHDLDSGFTLEPFAYLGALTLFSVRLSTKER